ncbi:MAG TPA: maleylpyruvate isomerase family mycothiol-dependent enzyme [Streptosporangiaceae bacterium]|nr:maleylpyruvate isomerase family mycothiol-dependent enzyme [Streptosporangiaceae bacterium]
MLQSTDAIRADRAALIGICNGLTAEQWSAPSGCSGWTVKDLVTHLGNLFWLVVDGTHLPDTTGVPTERAQEIGVEARRGMSAADVLADYEKVSDVGATRLAELAALDAELPLGEDFGTYSTRVLPSAYVFDHYTHIRADLFAPRGPLAGEPPPSDELRVAPTLDWIEAALPQQNRSAAGQCSLEIQVTGTGARQIKFGSGQWAATICSDAQALVRWITGRGDWADLGVQVAGDEQALAVARTLKVF